MSRYTPWAPGGTDTDPEGGAPGAAEPSGGLGPVAAGTPASAEDAAPYSPWTHRAPGQDARPKEARFETPPGLGATPQRKGHAPHETAAAMLLWTGGFVLIGSILFMAVMSLAIDFEHIDMRYGGHSDYDDVQAMEQIRGFGGWGIFASLLFLAPGVGLLYQQAWARPVGFIAASAALLLVPVGTALGIVGLVALSRMEEGQGAAVRGVPR